MTAQLRKVDIGNRRIAFNCVGSGPVTVLLETGLGAESSEWGTVQDALKGSARVYRYDRACRGQSDRAATPRSASDMVEDLQAVLRLADIPGPYVLVGHSFGGLLMRLYAHRYPHNVRGLVLVDSMHEDQFEIFGPLFPAATPEDPAELRAVREFWTGGWRNPESTPEGIDFVASIAQARAIDSLGDLPMQVLTAGTFSRHPLIPTVWREPLQQRWETLQARFLALSPAATQSFFRHSGHFMQRDAPGAIVAAALRAASPRAG